MNRPVLPSAYQHPCIAVGCMRLGTWGANLNTDGMEAFIEQALEWNLSLFDHADIYGDYSTETDFGKVLLRSPHLRPRMQLLSKCGIHLPGAKISGKTYHLKSYDCGADHITETVEQSLRNLNTDYLDILLLHRPDFLMQPEEIADAFEKLRQQGKVLAFGLSNFSPSQVSMLHQFFPDLTFHQIQCSPLHTKAFSNGVLDQCIAMGIRPMAWGALGGGQVLIEPRLKLIWQGLSAQYGVPVEAVVYAWLLRHPAGIIPITGSANTERLRAVVTARDISLSREDWYRIWQTVSGEVP